MSVGPTTRLGASGTQPVRTHATAIFVGNPLRQQAFVEGQANEICAKGCLRRRRHKKHQAPSTCVGGGLLAAVHSQRHGPVLVPQLLPHILTALLALQAHGSVSSHCGSVSVIQTGPSPLCDRPSGRLLRAAAQGVLRHERGQRAMHLPPRRRPSEQSAATSCQAI